MNSLRTRLLVAAALILTVFSGLAGLVLERAFQAGLLQAQQDKLQTLIYSLLGAASIQINGELTIALDAVPDPRLRQPLSGLEAALFNEEGMLVWTSAGNYSLTPPPAPAVGEWRFARTTNPEAFSLSFGLRWIDTADDPRRYTVVVLEDARAFDRQVRAFRSTLWLWLGTLLVALSLILLGLLRWGLLPLRRLGTELHNVEAGNQSHVNGTYPDELQPLVRDLNTMITSERNQQTRYRNALGDLAHALKTPLAVVRGMTGEPGIEDLPRRLLHEQVDRMHHIVDTQLRRAAAAGTRSLTEPIALRALVEKIASAIAKVYAERRISVDNRIPEAARLRADQGDLYDLIGNLLDNAAKYGHGQVRIDCSSSPQRFLITVDDDGPGFPDDAERMLTRGVRADTRVPGQGLGLAAVCDIVQAYGGQIELGRSDTLGGARVTVTLPSH